MEKAPAPKDNNVNQEDPWLTLARMDELEKKDQEIRHDTNVGNADLARNVQSIMDTGELPTISEEDLDNANVQADKDKLEKIKKFKDIEKQIKELEEQVEDTPEEDAPEEDAPEEDVPSEDTPEEDAPDEDAPNEDTPEEDTPDEDAPTKKHRPLAVINADWSHDAKEMAHDLAEQFLNKEIAEAKGLKRIGKAIWHGNFARKYFEQKYTKEFLNGEKTDEQGRTIKDIIKEQKDSVIERFTLGIVENDRRFVHEKAGESIEVSKDEKTNEAVKHAIEDYARARLKPGEKNLKDLNREFQNEVNRIMQEAMDDGRIPREGNIKTSNYLSVAQQAAEYYQELAKDARTAAEHDVAMEEVMAGFRIYNAEVRNGVRTEAHREGIDKIVDWAEKHHVAVPSEIIAGAAGAAMALTQTGARAIFGAAGGIIASSAISGLRERNRVTEDRIRMMRDIANGMEYGGQGSQEDIENLKGAAKRTAKYEQRIDGTLYDMQKATDLTSRIEAVMEDREGENHTRELLSAIAEARVRINFSDAEQKDLISYSSADKRGEERLKLDIALIKAEKSLSEQDKTIVRIMKEEILNKIIDGYDDESGKHHAGVEEKDKDFKKLRAMAALKKSGKSLALGAAFFFGSQEISAAISPEKIGIFEKAGILKTTNNREAEETIIASGFGFNRGKYIENVKEYTNTVENVSDPKQIEYYEQNGYTKTEVQSAYSEATRSVTGVDPSKSTARIEVKYDGWADNGTKVSDGNELRAYIQNGKFISNMRGSSTMNGQTINYDPTATKGFLTIGDAKFEVVGDIDANGQLSWGENGVFTTTTGETIRAIGDNGEKLYRYFEVAIDNGVEDGVQHIIPLATDVGANTFSGQIEQIVEEAIEQPAVYTFSKTFPIAKTFIRDVNTSGLAFGIPLTRTNLGAARAPEAPTMEVSATENTTNTNSTAENTTEATTETTSESSPQAPEATSEAAEPQDTANAPESAPVASESAPATQEGTTPEGAPATQGDTATGTETAPDNESEPDTFSDRILNEINNVKDLIGENGVKFMTNTDSIFGDTSEYTNWWNSLSENGRNAVRSIIDRIESSDEDMPAWGRRFRAWYSANAR